ncbi:MAG: hypothetical protein AAGM46_27680, partial [Cyanobacteria bacterium J06582_2]
SPLAVISIFPAFPRLELLVSTKPPREGIEVLWVGHTQAVSYRRQNNLPDKNDLADAMAIACYAHIYYGKQSYFINFDSAKLARIRELHLQLKSLARFQNPFINRGKQQLAREFPEAVSKKSYRQSDGRRPLWCWLAGRDRNLKQRSWYWEKHYSTSIAIKYGIEISQFTRWIAQTIDDIDIQHLEIEKELFVLVYSPEFENYNLVFDQFNFGLSFRALLLSQIYPIEKFESMAAFKKRIGAAKDEYASGDVNLLKKGGSKLCRTEFYLWVTTDIVSLKKRPQSDVGQLIGNKYDAWVSQFESDTELRQKQLAIKTQSKAIKSMRAIVSANLKPYVDGKELTSQLAMMETMFNASWQTNVTVGSLNKNQVKRKFGKLIIGKTTGYAARWLYRLLLKHCISDEQ